MIPLSKPAIRLSAQALCVFLVIVIALTLLIARQFDAPWAGGEGLGPHHNAILQHAIELETHTPIPLPASPSRGETLATGTHTFASYTLNDCKIALAENTALTLRDGRITKTAFDIITGRVIVKGDCRFLVREMEIHINGNATIVFPSWEQKIIVYIFEGDGSVNQSGTVTPINAAQNAIQFSTLPSDISHAPLPFSFEGTSLISAFYSWAAKEML